MLRADGGIDSASLLFTRAISLLPDARRSDSRELPTYSLLQTGILHVLCTPAGINRFRMEESGEGVELVVSSDNICSFCRHDVSAKALRKCNGCRMTRYGGNDCQRWSRAQHDLIISPAIDLFSPSQTCKSRPTACTFRSEPHLRRLAYATLQLQHRFSFFEIRGRTVQPHPSRFGLSNYKYQGMDSPNRLTQQQFSSAQ